MDEKITIVTGGGGKIGKGICRALAKSGATVVVLDLDPSGAEAAARRIECDVSDRAACAAAVDAVVSEFGGIDTLVNAAQGIRYGFPLLDVTDEDMRLSFDTGPTGTLRMMQLCYPHLKARGGGSIINFASGVGTEGTRGGGAYAAAKEAIRGITKVAAGEWAADNIRVNAVCPASSPDQNAAWVPAAIEIIPLKRIGDPEADVGGLIVYLASAAGSYMTGRTLHIDGGAGNFK